MTLRTRTLVIIGITLAGLTLAIYGVFDLSQQRDFAAAEGASVITDVERAERAVSDVDDDVIQAVNNCYASERVQNALAQGDDLRLGEVLGPPALAKLDVEFAVVLGADGRVRYAAALNPETGAPATPPAALLQPSGAADELVQRLTTQEAISGLLVGEDGVPLVIACHAFPASQAGIPPDNTVPSERRPPARGVLVLGRVLTVSALRALSESTLLSLNVFPSTRGSLPNDVAAARGRLQQESVVVTPLSSTAVAGYTQLNDLFGKPALLLRTETPRFFYTQLRNASVGESLSLFLVCLVFIVLSIVLLETLVLARLSRLHREVSTIRGEEGPQSRVTVEGDDELTALERGINATLDYLEILRERHSVVIESMEEIVLTSDMEGKVLRINAAGAGFFGQPRDACIGRSIDTLMHLQDSISGEAQPTLWQEAFAQNARMSVPPDTAMRRHDGVQRTVEGSAAPFHDHEGTPIGVVIVLRDVTELRERLGENARRTRLQSVGQLAGNIAHDFNNLFAAMAGDLDLASYALSGATAATARIAHARFVLQRATGLTQALLTFAAGGAPVKTLCALEDIIADGVDTALAERESRAEIAAPPDLWAVEADPGQITQLIRHLVANADQAAPGQLIRVNAHNVQIQADDISLVPGPYVLVTVADRGPGIPPEVRPHLFEPYFTTAPSERMGLGLAASYSIAVAHDGILRASSAPGSGAVFSLLLPAKPGLQPAPERATGAAGLEGARVLVMDDEEIVREVVVEMLATLGYEAEGVPDGAEAIACYKRAKKEGRPYALLLMDLTIHGGMGGAEAIAALRKLDPGVRAVVSSGYAMDPVMADYRAHGFVGVLSKPYHLADLAGLLGRVLSES